MPDRSDISPLSITDGKISKGAKIDPTKLAPATSGQVLIAGTDGKFRPGNLVTTSSGDTVAQGPAGATGATGSQGATGITGATGAAGVDGTDATVTETTVNAAGAIMHTDVPDSDTGFVKRTGAETYDVDTATYSTTGHTHDDRYYTETEADTLLATKSGTGHTHDDRYYTETEADTLLATKSGTGHTHDDRYYTETEADTLLATKSGTGHTHDDRYYTETEADTLLATKSATTHTHDGRYYTETETDTLLATKSGTGHTHDDRYYTETEADTLLATKAASSHTHDDRYYTETEADTLLATKAATSHTHDDRYYTETEADTLLATKAASSHTHDDRYYQESEFLNASAGAGDAGKPVKLDAEGHIDSTMINDGDISFVDLDDLPSTFTPSSHNHDHDALTNYVVGQHRTISDGSTGSTDLWSGSYIDYLLAAKADTAGTPSKYSRSVVWATTQSNVSYNVGNTIATLTHNLGSSYVMVSVKDVDGVIHNSAASNTGNYLLDLDYDVLVEVIDTNNISLEFNISSPDMAAVITNNNEFQVTVIG